CRRAPVGRRSSAGRQALGAERAHDGRTFRRGIEPSARLGRTQRMPATDAEVRAKFDALVNMSAREIEAWHKTEQSASVGQNSGDGVSIGVKAGQRTAQLLRAKRAPSADDLKHMRRVVS